jgi:predicted transcriptional regulator of viral defense system
MPDYEALFGVASSQAGHFTLEQALDLGVSKRMLSHHTKTRRFTREAPGVYRFRDYPDLASDVAVAWLFLQRRTGRALVSHESALNILELSDLVPRAIDITVDRARRPYADAAPVGVRIHTTQEWPATSEILHRRGVLLTGVERTLIDCILGATEGSMIRQALRNAFRERLTSPERLRAAAARRRQVSAVAVVERAIKDAHAGELAMR